MMSPKKKKIKLGPAGDGETSKRANEVPDSPRKRIKSIVSKEEEMKAKRRKNFITACEQVSCRDYFDYRARLLLVYLPSCMKTICQHHAKDAVKIKQMPSYADESFKTEMKNNMWYDALEVCQMSITSKQYLSADVLKDVVEIMLNAHEDENAEYTVKHIVDKCQQILLLNFSTHPPCLVKTLRSCYNDFLTSPMALKENTFTNRAQYECNKGIVKYCMNRLEHELSADSKDGPIFDKDENIPEEMKQTLRGLHWQKEKFEIFEILNRQERIERLFTVLETIIELLQFDLAVWHSRYSNDLGRHIMRSHKPLMAYVLWSENVLYTGAVTNNCRQILRIFSHIVHLKYPDSMVKVFATWLNTMIQTFYICEPNSNSDYPNTGKYCTVFANDFYKIICDLPHDSINRILERIQPTYMRHLVGLLHVNKILATDLRCILQILINFVSQFQWKAYMPNETEINISNKLFHPPKKAKRKMNYLLKKCNKPSPIRNKDNYFAKMEPKLERSTVELNHVVYALYITLDAYLDAYDLQSVQETWSNLNEQLLNDENMETGNIQSIQSFSVTESLIKKYRYILQTSKELMGLFSDFKKQGVLPDVMNIFSNIGLLEL